MESQPLICVPSDVVILDVMLEKRYARGLNSSRVTDIAPKTNSSACCTGHPLMSAIFISWMGKPEMGKRGKQRGQGKGRVEKRVRREKRSVGAS